MKTKKLEIKDFGNGTKAVLLGHYTDAGPTLHDLESIKQKEFAGVSAKKLRLWTDNVGRIYFGTITRKQR